MRDMAASFSVAGSLYVELGSILCSTLRMGNPGLVPEGGFPAPAEGDERPDESIDKPGSISSSSVFVFFGCLLFGIVELFRYVWILRIREL